MALSEHILLKKFPLQFLFKNFLFKEFLRFAEEIEGDKKGIKIIKPDAYQIKANWMCTTECVITNCLKVDTVLPLQNQNIYRI